jgi:transmembrane sensor
MPTERFKFLIGLYFDRTINGAQQSELSRWVTNHASDEELIKLLEEAMHEHKINVTMPDMESDRILSAVLNSGSQKINEEGDNKVISVNTNVLWLKRMAVAASILLIFSIGYFKLRSSIPPVSIAGEIKRNKSKDIKPGGQKALLTLSDGSQIVLDSASNGILALQGNTKVIKLANGKLTYASSPATSAEILYNTMSTPVGGQYQLSLPDGSKVWLNAASSIRYPTAFSEKLRRVEITGEAYFEIAKNEKVPFIVQFNNGSEVKVLGTHFNIKAYADEQEIKTTLLEGSIIITHGQKNSLLKPGNQAQINREGIIKVTLNADTEEAVAWKKGNFQFNKTDLQTVMRQAARWYNLDVEYKGKPSDDNRFTGKIPMSVNLSQLLKWMEWSDVHFKLEGNKLTVMP